MPRHCDTHTVIRMFIFLHCDRFYIYHQFASSFLFLYFSLRIVVEYNAIVRSSDKIQFLSILYKVYPFATINISQFSRRVGLLEDDLALPVKSMYLIR